MSLFRKILVPTDFSENAHHALERAIALAKATDAELHLCHAVQFVAPIVTPYEVPIPDDFAIQAREAARRHLDDAMKGVTAAGLTGEAHLLAEAADPGISELARSLGVDLIVMGTRGITGLKHVLLGSVAERTVRHAPCSVLTVKRAST